MRRILALWIAMGAITACASDTAGSTASGAETTQAPTSAPVIEPTSAPTPAPTSAPAVTEPEPVLGEELVGRWAHYDVVAYQDDLLKTLIISYGFNDFTEVDGRIVDQSSFCFSEQRTDQPITTSLSDAAT
ncbi:MAG: hypothetical protein ACM3MM_11445, partial [Acidobacteriota bacterium]